MARQRLRPEVKVSKEDTLIAQKVFRNWCGDNGCMVEAIAAADLVKKIAEVVSLTRSSISPSEGETP